MTTFSRAMFFALALSVSACGAPEAEESGAGAPAAEVAAASSLEASALPTLRPGLWRTVSNTDGEAGDTEDVCVRPGQAVSDIQLAQTPGCTTNGFARVAGGYRMEAVCQEATSGARLRVSSIMGGDMQTTFSSDLTLTVEIPGAPATVTEVQVRGQRIGDCAG